MTEKTEGEVNYKDLAMRDLQEIQTRKAAIDAKSIEQENMAEELRQQMLISVLKNLEAVGVNTSDIESIRAFLSQLEQVNPDLRVMLETSLDALLPKATPQVADGVVQAQ